MRPWARTVLIRRERSLIVYCHTPLKLPGPIGREGSIDSLKGRSYNKGSMRRWLFAALKKFAR